MARSVEGKLKHTDNQLAEALGWIPIKCNEGDGEPDTIYMKQGRCFTVERKKPKGTQQRNQKLCQIRYGQHGIPYYLVDAGDLSQMKEILLIEEAKF